MPSKEKSGGSKQFGLETNRSHIMKKMSLQSIARSYDRAVSNPNPEAFVRHMCTVFRENPVRWSNAVDKFSKHGK